MLLNIPSRNVWMPGARVIIGGLTVIIGKMKDTTRVKEGGWEVMKMKEEHPVHETVMLSKQTYKAFSANQSSGKKTHRKEYRESQDKSEISKNP